MESYYPKNSQSNQQLNKLTKTAPGPDTIPKKVSATFFARYPTIVADIFTMCLCPGKFPASWKGVKLILIKKLKKPDKPGILVSSNMPP